MASLESAFFAVEQLAKDFKANENHYLRPEYSESQARIDFIDKFFTALGWDVNHEEQKNPYEQEVKVERNVSVGAAQKRADYAFCLYPNFRDPKFYAEAKKPSRSLSNADDYFQAIRYGWNSANPLAILTDFEEFHVIDSRYKPNIKTALSFKLKHYTYDDYLDKDKFAEIYYLFSRESVGAGSIEKYAETLVKPKKAKGAMPSPSSQAIDESFLEELDKIRNTLAKSFKKRNPGLYSAELTEATQRTIDRLVFLRFLEDKLIEGESHIDYYISRKSAWDEFISDSRALNAKYNGVVFRNHPIIDSDKFIPPDEKEFRGICEELSFKNSPYHFNFIPIHILGSIYERFLGKVVHATDKQVKIEDKPEVRKAGGVYYTPQYIVQYIVENTVGKIIEGKTPQEISKLRFADISCGSGSFLITVYDTLLAYHGKWYQTHPEQAKKDGCIEKGGLWILSIEQKKDILLNNIYGVDIDYQAVEVTQLSLYLKLLEDESQASILQEEMFYKNKRVLPDLSKNIVCGNSLIGTDFETQNIFESDLSKSTNTMDFGAIFPQIMNGGGFDCIVGNPPWVDIKGLPPSFVDYYFKRYTSVENRINIYAIFVERSLSLLNKSGVLGYIIPNSILYQSSYTKLRKKILDHYGINKIIRLPDDTFVKVKAETVILVLTKDKSDDCECIIFDRQDKINSISGEDAKEEKVLHPKEWLLNDFNVFDIYTGKEITNLLGKIANDRIKLEDLCDFTLGITPYDKYKGHTQKQIKEKVFHATFAKDDSFKKLLDGADVSRYKVTWNGTGYISYGKWLGAPREKRFFVGDRILIRQIVSGSPLRIYAAYTNEELYNVQSIFNILVKNDCKLHTKYFLGIINSKLMNFYHSNKFLDLSKNLFQKILIQNCKLFPMQTIDFQSVNEKSQHDKMVFLVDKMIEAKKQLAAATTEKDGTYYENMCNAIDRQIDQLVYELYGLTEEEINIVEGQNPHM